MNAYPNSAPCLVSIGECAAPVLESVHLSAVLEDLLGQVELRQGFVNHCTQPIEAVYTFPVPLGAVLLGFTVKLGERELIGRIMAAPKAQSDYEEAVTDGDAAVLLEEAGPGLYTVNVGNLLPGERTELTYRYAQLQYWQGDTLRFALPTVIAPRYGDPQSGGMQPHQTPETNFFEDHRMGIRITVRGLLEQAEVTCPTHKIQIDRAAGEAVVRFAGLEEQSMDRDIVLNLRRRHHEAASAQVEPTDTGDEHLALLTVCPEFDHATSPAPRFVKVLVDCSGSMQGPSIGQAREALRRILDSLRPQDYFTIVAFGSTHRFVTEPVLKADPLSIEAARQAIKTVHASLGGTELREALLAVLALKAPRGAGSEEVPGDVLLITDGEVYDDSLAAKVREAGDRVFTVGVGCAPGESLLGSLADATGGAAEFVTPGDDMAGRIHRHFQRLYQPRVRTLAITWPGQVLDERRDREGGIFAGDTVHCFARLAGGVAATGGEVSIHCRLEDGRELNLKATTRLRRGNGGSLPGANLLDRLMTAGAIAAARTLHISSAERDRLTDLAVRCQLMSPWTSCLVVAERAEHERTNGLPDLRKVQQMMAAGSHGMGSELRFMSTWTSAVPRMSLARPMEPSHCMPTLPFGFDLERLAALGVPRDVLADLQQLMDEGADENTICLLYLHALLKAGAKLKGLGRNEKREIRRDAKQRAAGGDLVARVGVIAARWKN